MIHLGVGSRLQGGKYEIVKILGQGGFGITYLVRHTILDTFVAIKEFFPDMYCQREDSTSRVSVITDSNYELVSQLRRRFISEAKNIASLNHAGIVRIQDIFEENGTAYFVMDYIEGESLEDIVSKGGALSEKKAIDYISKVGEALEYIHGHKIAHFDVKPANIMVRREDDMPILIDFGLSKQFNEHGAAKSTILMGISRGYSPMEQYYEDGITGFSPQTDVYALAATLYFTITGRVPPESLKLVGEEIAVPVNISAMTSAAIKKAMRSGINQRTQSARDFVKELAASTHSASGDRNEYAGPQSHSYSAHKATEPSSYNQPPRPPRPPRRPKRPIQELGKTETKKTTKIDKVLLILVGILIVLLVVFGAVQATKRGTSSYDYEDDSVAVEEVVTEEVWDEPDSAVVEEMPAAEAEEYDEVAEEYSEAYGVAEDSPSWVEEAK